MSIETVNPPGSEFLLENFHFSQAAWHDGVLLCSGQIGTAADGTVPAEAAEEFANAWAAVGRLLEAAGLGFEDIVEYTTYHVGLHDHLAAFVAARDAVLRAPWPAWTAIGIGELAIPGARVEIRVIARRKRG